MRFKQQTLNSSSSGLVRLTSSLRVTSKSSLLLLWSLKLIVKHVSSFFPCDGQNLRSGTRSLLSTPSDPSARRTQWFSSSLLERCPIIGLIRYVHPRHVHHVPEKPDQVLDTLNTVRFGQILLPVKNSQVGTRRLDRTSVPKCCPFLAPAILPVPIPPS